MAEPPLKSVLFILFTCFIFSAFILSNLIFVLIAFMKILVIYSSFIFNFILHLFRFFALFVFCQEESFLSPRHANNHQLPTGVTTTSSTQLIHCATETCQQLSTLHCSHNHVINAADALRHRDVSDQVEQKFKQLFEKGHSPSSALESHKCDMQTKDEEHFSTKLADRYLCPDLQWVFCLYYQIFRAEYGSQNNSDMLDMMRKRSIDWNGTNSDTVALESTDDSQVTVAICTPSMKRVHAEIVQSSELVFLDSSGCMDMNNCRVFAMLTNRCAGGLPLGLFITTTETDKAIISGLKLLQTLLPSNAFHGRNIEGPYYFTTDDCVAERNALKAVYASSVVLLCQFHVMWAAWRWLWKSTNGIAASDYSHLYSLIRLAVDAETSTDLADAFTILHSDTVAVQYDRFLSYVDKMLEKSELWASCY